MQSDTKEFDPKTLIDLLEPDIDSPEGLPDLLRLAYFASLHTEELRPVRARLAVSKADLRPPALLELEAPQALDVNLIRKRCCAADPATTSCLVARRDEQWQLVGLCCRPPKLSPLIDGFEVQIDGPGRVEISQGIKVAAYDKGRFFVPDARPEIERLLPQGAVDGLFERTTRLGSGRTLRLGRGVIVVEQALWEEHRQKFEEYVREVVGPAITGGIIEISKEAKRLGHGAGIIVLPAGSDSSSLAAIGNGSIFKPTPESFYSPWNQGLLDYVGTDPHVRLAQDGKYMMADLEEQFTRDLDRWRERAIGPILERANRLAFDDAKRCAQLTQVDGATVFSSTLEPVAFGVTVRLDDDETSQKWGHRHKSIRQAIMRVDGSLGVVVSQDGQVRLFRAPDAIDGVEVDL